MGYNTKFEFLSANGGEQLDHEELIQETTNGSFESECKWYDFESEMRNYSKAYPETLFVIKGEGEESGDIWKAYIKNGLFKKDMAKLEFPAFYEGLLS